MVFGVIFLYNSLLLSDRSILNDKFLEPFDLAVVGGGAAGFMTAITAAENGVKRIIILEGTSKLMEKVRISGGGRCNVTNATWIPNELVAVSYTHLTLPTKA